MLRRVLGVLAFILLMTFVLYFFNLLVTHRIAKVLSHNFRKSDSNSLHIGNIQTNYLSRIRFHHVDFNLTRYSFLSRLVTKEIISDFNILDFIKGNTDILNRVTVVWPQLFCKEGSLELGIKRLIADLGDVDFRHRIEVQNGTLVFETNQSAPLLVLKDIWGHFNPLENGNIDFILTNHRNSVMSDTLLIKGSVNRYEKEGQVHVSLSNINIGHMLSQYTGMDIKKIVGSINFLLTWSDENWEADIENIRIHSETRAWSGSGMVYPGKDDLAVDLALDFSGKKHDGLIRISGGISRPYVKVEYWTRSVLADQNKIIARGHLLYDNGLVFDNFRIDAGWGNAVLDGFATFSSMEMEFEVNEKFYNDVSLTGKVVSEIIYSSSQKNKETNNVKMLFSDMKIDNYKISDIFIDLSYTQSRIHIKEARSQSVNLQGSIDITHDPAVFDLMLTCENSDIETLKPVLMKRRRHAHLSGDITGTLSLRGHKNAMGGKGSFVIKNGSVGMISEFKRMVFDFTWNGPILMMNDARIIREEDYFVLNNTIDLSATDILANLEIEHVGKSMEWEGWTVNSPDPGVGLDVFGDIGQAGLSESRGDDKNARKTLLDLEYDLDNEGNEILFKIKENESFMGFGKEIKF